MDNQFDPKASYIFRLTLGNNITDPDKQLGEVVLDLGTEKKFKDKSHTLSALMLNVNFERKIYQPGAIEIDINVKEYVQTLNGPVVPTNPSFQSVSSLFLRRMVTLAIHPVTPDGNQIIVDSQNRNILAQNYYVHEVNPQLKRDSDGLIMYIKLQIFSMDKLMTLNKYSKAYVARKLGSGILMPECRMFGYQENAEKPLIQTNVASMRFLKYQAAMSFTDNTLQQSVTAHIPSEFIHPYLVQYNETFYDFMVRTSNRCGEFFYFEDGKLILGLPDSDGITEINSFDSVTLMNTTSGPLNIKGYARDSMKEDADKVGELNYSVVKKNAAGFPNEAFPAQMTYNSEVATDEYLFPLYKDKFTSVDREWMKDMPPMKVLNNLKTVTTGEDLGSSIAQAGVNEGTLAILSAIQSKTYNDKMDKEFLTPLKNKSEQSASDHAVLFGSLGEEGWTTLDYYNDVRAHEEEQQRQIISIDMGINIIPLKLGQKIKLKGVEGNYIVIQIQQCLGDVQKEHKRSLKILAIPSYMDPKDETEKFFPPVQPVSIIRKAGPQTAFVTDNNDPKYQGRVRIAYPWQSLAAAEKKKLQDAQTSLQQAKDQEKALAQQVEAWKTQKHDLLKEIELLTAYLKASAEERTSMESQLGNDITFLEKEISDLTQELSIRKSKIASNQSADEASIQAKAIDEAVAKELEERIEAKKEEINKKRQTAALWQQALEKEQQHHGEESYSYTNNETLKEIQKAYDNVCADLKTAREFQEKAQETVKKSQQSADKTKVEVQKTIAQVATPWIRVVTPMATNGGGTYFKPQIGDEVLVNYDNDNIERPYVVGSLFSKNTLEPAERYDRRGAPEVQFGPNKLVSMSITSPNGHHITFSDPDSGDKFIAGLNPGTQFLGSFLPTSVLKNERDLAGGIHIGDRYGIYEIEMQSHNRSISIKSPLGTVDINAFTGITISANNGDINIKGKNINIEAGNKLTLTSGTNILKPSISDPDFALGSPIWQQANHWYTVVPNFFAKLGRSIGSGALWLGQQVLSAAPAAVSEKTVAPFADLSLFRHVFELAVKPVDGTLLVKSRRYLMLEAGKGEAKIIQDHLKAPGSISSIEKFYQDVSKEVLNIENKMNNFFFKYETLWNSAVKARVNYENFAKKMFRDELGPEILVIVWNSLRKHRDWIDDIKSSHKEFADRPFIDGKQLKYVTEKNEVFLSHAVEYGNYISNLINFMWTSAVDFTGVNVDSVFDGGDFEPNPMRRLLSNPDPWMNNSDPIRDAVEEAYQFIFGYMQKAWINRFADSTNTVHLFKREFLNPENVEGLYTDRIFQTICRRKAVAAFIYNVSKCDMNRENKYLEIGFDLSDIVGKDLLNDKEWKDLMTLHDKRGIKSLTFLLEGLLEPIKKKFTNPIGVVKENEIWSEKKDGQILFSENNGATLSFKGEGLHSEANSNIGNRDRLLQVLLSIN